PGESAKLPGAAEVKISGDAATTDRFARARPATSVNLRIASVQVRGPLNPKFWTTPDNYSRFFPQGPAPEDAAGRDAYAAELLRKFATRAFRRPIDEHKTTQLVALARQVYAEPGK